jgi:bifunctional non-homologous end joining protein LigD
MMPQRQFEPCLPMRRTVVPTGADWIHEVKHDGYRPIVERNDRKVRLFIRNGHLWTDRYPWIVQAALQNRQKHFVLDGEAVILGLDGVSDFDALHSGKHNEEVQFYAFDVIASDGEDLRRLQRLLARRPEGITVAPFETGEIGPDLFRKACEYGLEDLVSNHRNRAYRPGRSPNWIKVKNPEHPAMTRVKDALG